MKYYYDLHIHSCLSPCGDNDMTPNNIVNMAILNELDIIAVSDHNTALNVKAVLQVAEKTPLLVVPAIEVCTSEEVHVLCLFYEFDDCMRFSDFLYSTLPPIDNNPKIFGEQLIANQKDEVVGFLDKLLINASSISIDKLVVLMREYNGLAIPAHIDRNSYSIISNLGFIPPDLNLPCVEIKKPPFMCNFQGNVVTNSDAHYLENIGMREHYLELKSLSVKNLIDSLKTQGT